MTKNSTKYFILLFLAFMFAAPGISAYLFYAHPGWLSAATTNKGHLLNPPVVLKSLDAQAKWRIVFWSPGACDTDCLKQLDTLARVRLALGRKLYYVDQWLILGEEAPDLKKKAKTWLAAEDFHLTKLSAEDAAILPKEATIFLASPENYLILSYKSQTNPDDVYKDLKLLLSTTENKSGTKNAH